MRDTKERRVPFFCHSRARHENPKSKMDPRIKSPRMTSVCSPSMTNCVWVFRHPPSWCKRGRGGVKKEKKGATQEELLQPK
jgi:hypothetical protein